MNTGYPAVDRVLSLLLAELRASLEDRFVGLYLFGSLAGGDFDESVSDIDLIVAVSGELSGEELERLARMHRDIALRDQQWDDRLDVHYIAVQALRTYDPDYLQPLISPGEPFNVRKVESSWVLNRRMLRERGVALAGPPIASLIDPVPMEAVIRAIRETKQPWLDYLPDIRRRKTQAFAILTMCRALYALAVGELPAKREAADWAIRELPERAPLIRQALAWRTAVEDGSEDHEASLPETRSFVREALARF